jgi:hypothetical protein
LHNDLPARRGGDRWASAKEQLQVTKMSAAAQLEHLLRTPKWLVTVVYLIGAVPIPWPRSFSGPGWHITVAPAYSPGVMAVLAILFWLYALYSASVRRTQVAPDRLRVVFAVAAVSYIFTFCLGHVAYFWRGQPPAFLLATFGLVLAPAVVGMIVGMALAANALSDFEASLAPKEPQSLHPFLPVIFLGIGIWFIHRRILAMLAHPWVLEKSL